MGELDPLRRSGGAGRVDQREDVVGLHRPPRGLEVEVGGPEGFDLGQRVGGALGLAVDDDEVVEGDPGAQDRWQEGGLGDGDPVARIAEEVLDLLRRRRVVDREGGHPQVHRPGVDPGELGSVAEHDAEGVPALVAEGGQTCGDGPHVVAVLGPRDRDGVACGAQCHGVRVDGQVCWKASQRVVASDMASPSQELSSSRACLRVGARSSHDKGPGSRRPHRAGDALGTCTSLGWADAPQARSARHVHLRLSP